MKKVQRRYVQRRRHAHSAAVGEQTLRQVQCRLAERETAVDVG
jgi:hypothetical protein